MTSTTDLSCVESATRAAVPSYPQIVRIMNLVRKEVEIPELEDEFKADPDISWRLMATALGFPREIKSYRQVITYSVTTGSTAG